MKPTIRPHDYEEFAEIIERRGFWRKDRGERMVQQSLFSAESAVNVVTMAGENESFDE